MKPTTNESNVFPLFDDEVSAERKKCDCCGDWLTVRCGVCRGCPDEGADIRQLACGIAAVDRATSGRT